jgi:hypothetical protein
MKQKVSGLAILSITLYWLAFGYYLFALTLFVGLSTETVYWYLWFGILILLKAFFEILEATFHLWFISKILKIKLCITMVKLWKVVVLLLIEPYMYWNMMIKQIRFIQMLMFILTIMVKRVVFVKKVHISFV